MKGERGSITEPTGTGRYPVKGDNIADEATADRGGNFGRLARCGIMDDYIDQMRRALI